MVPKKPKLNQAKKKRFVSTALDSNGFTMCQSCHSYLHKDDVDEYGHKLITVDHVVPLSKGGTNHYENLMILCQTCNLAKGSLSLEDFKLLVRLKTGKFLTETQKDSLLHALADERTLGQE